MESAIVSDENNVDLVLPPGPVLDLNPQTTQLLNGELDSTSRSGLETDEVSQDDLLRRIGETTTKLAVHGKTSEDDGFTLKTGECMRAWYELETELKTAIQHIREGNIRPGITLKQSLANGKALLKEISLRVKVYDAAMALHEALFRAARAEEDMKKLEAHQALTQATQNLNKALMTIPQRFKAAQRDLQSARKALKNFIKLWNEDLLERVNMRPQWIPDSFSEHCSSCQKVFGVLRTKHHCRACGLVFCDACTSQILALPNLAYFSPRRVCQNCFQQYQPFAVEQNGAVLEQELNVIFPGWDE